MEDDEQTKIVNYFNTLENSYYEDEYISQPRTQNSFIEKYTGLTKGTVRDIIIYEDNIELIVDTKNNVQHEFKLNKVDNYDKNSEFIRFLEYYNISLSQPSELFGLNVIIKKNCNGWNLYIPDNKLDELKHYIDKFARYFGYHQLNIKRKFPGEIYIGAVILLSVSISFSTLFYNFYQLLTIHDASMMIFLYVSILTPFISSIITRVNKICNGKNTV